MTALSLEAKKSPVTQNCLEGGEKQPSLKAHFLILVLLGPLKVCFVLTKTHSKKYSLDSDQMHSSIAIWVDHISVNMTMLSSLSQHVMVAWQCFLYIMTH